MPQAAEEKPAPAAVEEKAKTSFTLGRETIEALDEIKRGLQKAHPNARLMHSRNFAVELSVHYALGQIRKGGLTYEKFFATPFARSRGSQARR